MRSLSYSFVLAALVLSCGADATVSPTDPGTTPPGETPPGTTPPGTTPPGTTPPGTTPPAAAGPIKNVFIIVMENHSWAGIKGSASAPYINGTLMKDAGYAEAYSTPAGNHPSEPNYIWLEAGDNLGITNDAEPSANHKATKEHLTSQLDAKGVSWRTYAEDIDGTKCPLTSAGLFGTKHTPMLFFDDVTDTNTPTSANCIAHVRPYGELATDITANKLARYSFITPNLCNDMHGEAIGATCFALTTDLVAKGDTWLKNQVPKILDSAAYKDNGVLFIVWDEGDAPVVGSSEDGPIPMFVLSAKVKPGPSMTKYTHSSMLRTIEAIFGVPYLRGAAASNDLSDMFTSFP